MAAFTLDPAELLTGDPTVTDVTNTSMAGV